MLNGSTPGASGSHCDCNDNKNLVTLKGELIACCDNSSRMNYGEVNEFEITANLGPKGTRGARSTLGGPVNLNVVESMLEESLEDAIDHRRQIEEANLKDPNRDPNKFSQYGGWTTEGLGDRSMYGVNHNFKNQEVVK
jgi:hypothetical protein